MGTIMNFDSIAREGANPNDEIIDLERTQAICNFKDENETPNDVFMKARDQMTDGISLQSDGGIMIKRKESKLKLRIRKALTSLKAIVKPKTRLEQSESMINPDKQTSQTISPRKTASETL